MKKFAIALISLPLVAFSGAALAGDAEAGAAKAEACLDCHMTDDFSGLGAEEIQGLIVAARGSEDHDPVINDVAEEDIADVAAYFAHEGAK